MDWALLSVGKRAERYRTDLAGVSSLFPKSVSFHFLQSEASSEHVCIAGDRWH